MDNRIGTKNSAARATNMMSKKRAPELKMVNERLLNGTEPKWQGSG